MVNKSLLLLGALAMVVTLLVSGLFTTFNPVSPTAIPTGATIHLSTPRLGAWAYTVNVTVPDAKSWLGNDSVSQAGCYFHGTVEGNAPFSIVVAGNGALWASHDLPSHMPEDVGPVTGTGSYYHPIFTGRYSITFVSQENATILLDAAVGVVC